jgi:hypothetical protein
MERNCWLKEENTSMRLARYQVPNETGSSAVDRKSGGDQQRSICTGGQRGIGRQYSIHALLQIRHQRWSNSNLERSQVTKGIPNEFCHVGWIDCSHWERRLRRTNGSNMVAVHHSFLVFFLATLGWQTRQCSPHYASKANMKRTRIIIHDDHFLFHCILDPLQQERSHPAPDFFH